MELIEIIGFTGAGLIILGFYRLHVGKWGNGSLIYELDNLLGAGLLAYYALHHRSYPALVLNLVWIFVAVRGLESLAVRRRKGKKRAR